MRGIKMKTYSITINNITLYVDKNTYNMFNEELERRVEKNDDYSTNDFITELITERLEAIDNENE
jgi:hypothetical protein